MRSRRQGCGWYPARILLYLMCFCGFSSTELEILVKNGGGDILKTKIFANITEDTITTELVESEGSLVTLLVDFKAGLKIFKAYILGETERSQNGYQVLCFILSLRSSDFIPTDAMSKLRQKNPGTIRTAEEDTGLEEYEFDIAVDLKKSSILSNHIEHMCSQAPSSTFIHSLTLDSIKQSSGYVKNITDISSVGSPLPLSDGKRCSEVHIANQSCLCEYTMCLHWFPCGIKYCKDKDVSTGKVVSRRCGIKTCKKRQLFHFYVSSKLACLWDELPFLIS